MNGLKIPEPSTVCFQDSLSNLRTDRSLKQKKSSILKMMAKIMKKASWYQRKQTLKFEIL